MTAANAWRIQLTNLPTSSVDIQVYHLHDIFTYYMSILLLYIQFHCRYQWQFLDSLLLGTSYFHAAVWGVSCIQSQHQQLEYEIIINPVYVMNWLLHSETSDTSAINTFFNASRYKFSCHPWTVYASSKCSSKEIIL